MSTVKKRQHYVWRKYLEPWTKKNTIWTLFLKSDKIKQTGLMNVAQEKYFYKMVQFTSEEEVFLRNYIEKNCPKDLQDLNIDFLNSFILFGHLKKKLAIFKDKGVNIDKLKSEIDKLEINTIENYHSYIESTGNNLIKCRSLSDLKLLDQNYIHMFEAMMFLSHQYFRTKKMKKQVLLAFKGDKFEKLAEKSWHVIRNVMSTQLAKSLCLDKKIKFIFIENNTKKHFITGDQPVFNILGDNVDEQGNTIELELYYPISPIHAINIHFREEQVEKFINKIANEELVNFLNNKAIQNSNFFVFSDTKELLSY